MRKVIVSNLVSLDGYFAGPNGEVDWFINLADKEFEADAIDLIGTVDTMLFGRITYELMASYWPTASPDTEDPRIIAAMNNTQKAVFSNTLDTVDWNNSRLVRGDVADEVARLKQEPGKDMVIYGSGSIVAALTRRSLIDDYRIFVCPIILGDGKSLFKGSEQLALELVESRRFGSGVVLLSYRLSKG
jgi:dihydrofolate reductase